MKKKIVSGIIIVAVLALIAVFLVNRNTAIQVTTAEVIEGPLQKYVEEIGVVYTENREVVYATAGGKVIELNVEIGSKVKAGDVLAVLDDRQVLAQIQELESQKTLVQAQLNEVSQPIDSREIEKLRLEQENMKRLIEQLERTADNQEKLAEAGAISQEEYRNTLTNLELQKNALEKLALEIELLEKPASVNIIAQYQAQLQQVAVQMEELLRVNQDYVITAGMEGTVLSKAVDTGKLVQPGMVLMELGNTEELYIESDVLLSDIAQVREGARVLISSNNLDIESAAGVVRKIHPQAFSKVSDLGIEQKRIKVEIEMSDPIATLKPGYDLDIKIVTEERENALLIPENAVFQQDGKFYVFVSQDNRASLREIEKGLESQKLVEVVKGLAAGEKVIQSPDQGLTDGAAIIEE